MSSGTRSRPASASKPEEVACVTVDEIEKIVEKAVSTAMSELRELFNNKLSDFESRISVLESRISVLEDNLSQTERDATVKSDQSQVQVSTEIVNELSAIRAESRDSMLLSNDNEQYSRGNNLRFCGLVPEENNDCRAAAAKFIKNVLRITTVTECDIEAAHMIPGSLQSTDTTITTNSQRKRPIMMVRFTRKDSRDVIIRSRKILKGTHYAIVEDLTALNVKTMNRLRNHEQVRTVWSWNGKIFAILSNGRKVMVKPFQPISELL